MNNYFLYDGLGHIAYIHVEMIAEMMRCYGEFDTYRRMINSEETETIKMNAARELIRKIPEFKRKIPIEIRGKMPDLFQLSDDGLNQLERKAKKILGINDEGPAM